MVRRRRLGGAFSPEPPAHPPRSIGVSSRCKQGSKLVKLGRERAERRDMADDSSRPGGFGHSGVPPVSPVRPLRIALVCDFFYPRIGGVENHIWSLANALLTLGHKVIVITHAYDSPDCPDHEFPVSLDIDDHEPELRNGGRLSGVRYFPGGLKVYYCPFLVMVDEVCLPTFTASYPLMRWIFIREGIQVVHSHQATSAMGNEAITYSAEMGLASVYTDHSLFGFHDLASVVLNRVLQVTMSTLGGAICVSNICKENYVQRTKVDPEIVHVIPNAIDCSKFTPDPTKRGKNRIKVVIVSRLVFRKGVDLMVGIIPRICEAFPNVDFIIGGDGSKRFKLDDMVERERLRDRVEFLGFVPHKSVRDVLVRGHIFLNCSLTESFCIAILEAASAGLPVVATNVGGVPEILPPDMIDLADPNVDDMVRSLSDAIRNKVDRSDPHEYHRTVKAMYSWDKVASETVNVYLSVMSKPRLSFLQRLDRYKSVGPIAGYVVWILAVTQHLVALLIEFLQPRRKIDVITEKEKKS